jgi:hypothetical protein
MTSSIVIETGSTITDPLREPFTMATTSATENYKTSQTEPAEAKVGLKEVEGGVKKSTNDQTTDISEIASPLGMSTSESSPKTSSPQEEVAASTDEESEDSDPSTALLYCIEKGRNHANLVEWEIFMCPSCGQDLKPPKPRTNDGQKKKNKEKPGKEQVDPIEEQDHVQDAPNVSETPDVRYKIKYFDKGGYIAAIQPWHDRLNLETERRKVISKEQAILEIVTVVQTNIKADSNRYEYEKEKLLKEGILTNPKYTMEHGWTEIEIYSRSIIEVLHRLVTYHPGMNLTGETIILKEPFCLFFYHFEDLSAYQMTYPGAEGHEAYKDDPLKNRTDIEKCDEETYNHLNLLRHALKFDRRLAEYVTF